MPVLSSGAIVSPAYFTKGSAFAFEFEGGALIHITPLLGLAVLGNFSQYGLSFTPAATDAFRATGASDTYYGGRALATFTL